MRAFLFLLSALLMLQAPQPAAAFARAAWSVAAHDEHVLPARHVEPAVASAQKRIPQSVRLLDAHALPPQAFSFAAPSLTLERLAADKSFGAPRALPRVYDATGPPAA